MFYQEHAPGSARGRALEWRRTTAGRLNCPCSMTCSKWLANTAKERLTARLLSWLDDGQPRREKPEAAPIRSVGWRPDDSLPRCRRASLSLGDWRSHQGVDWISHLQSLFPDSSAQLFSDLGAPKPDWPVEVLT